MNIANCCCAMVHCVVNMKAHNLYSSYSKVYKIVNRQYNTAQYNMQGTIVVL